MATREPGKTNVSNTSNVDYVWEHTFTMFTSKRTHNVLEPIASNTSSVISPVGNIFAGEGEGGGAKSRGMGGRFFVFEPGESGRVSLLLSMGRLDVASLTFAVFSGLIV